MNIKCKQCREAAVEAGKNKHLFIIYYFSILLKSVFLNEDCEVKYIKSNLQSWCMNFNLDSTWWILTICVFVSENQYRSNIELLNDVHRQWESTHTEICEVGYVKCEACTPRK